MDSEPQTPWPGGPTDWLVGGEALLRYADCRLEVDVQGAWARELATAIGIDQVVRTTELHYQADQRWP